MVAGLVLLIALLALPAPARQAVRPPDPDPLAGRVWTATHASAAPGTLRIFLPDGTLVMTSCAETYRLARWNRVSPQRIAWEEDGAKIDAEVTSTDPDRLELKLLLRGGVRTETYTSAAVPFTCPSIRPATEATGLRGATQGREDTGRISNTGTRLRAETQEAGTPKSRGPAPVLSPPPAAWRCEDETFRITFEATRAFVTMPDRSVITLPRTDKDRSVTAPRTYSNGRVTFEHAPGASATSVRFARGRRAFTDCQQVK